jgi:hypothetical protein
MAAIFGGSTVSNLRRIQSSLFPSHFKFSARDAGRGLSVEPYIVAGGPTQQSFYSSGAVPFTLYLSSCENLYYEVTWDRHFLSYGALSLCTLAVG